MYEKVLDANGRPTPFKEIFQVSIGTKVLNATQPLQNERQWHLGTSGA